MNGASEFDCNLSQWNVSKLFDSKEKFDEAIRLNVEESVSNEKKRKRENDEVDEEET